MSDENFKYLVEELGSKNLELLKEECASPYEYMNSFEKFNGKYYLLENVFIALQGKEKLIMMIKYQMAV